MPAAVEQARAAGATHLERTVRDRFLARYEALLADGLAHHPQPPPAGEGGTRRRGRRTQSPVRHLLDRLWAFAHAGLACLADVAIPVDNHQAERDRRPIQIPPTISGTCRSEPGADALCCLRSVLAPWRNQGRSGLAALEAAFTGHPLSLQPPS